MENKEQAGDGVEKNFPPAEDGFDVERVIEPGRDYTRRIKALGVWKFGLSSGWARAQ